MVLIVHPKRPPTGEPATMQEMGKFAAELVGAGKMRGGAPLHPEEQGVRLRLGDTGRVVTDGPFAESKEVVGGFFVLEAASREEAIELAKRCPHVRAGIAEVRVLPDRDVNRRAEGKSFLFLLHMEPDLTDPDGSGYRQMVAYDEVLKKEGRYLESSQLGSDPPGARIETRGGKARHGRPLRGVEGGRRGLLPGRGAEPRRRGRARGALPARALGHDRGARDHEGRPDLSGRGIVA